MIWIDMCWSRPLNPNNGGWGAIGNTLRENFGNIMGVWWEQQKPTLPKRKRKKKLGLLSACSITSLREPKTCTPIPILYHFGPRLMWTMGHNNGFGSCMVFFLISFKNEIRSSTTHVRVWGWHIIITKVLHFGDGLYWGGFVRCLFLFGKFIKF